MNEFNPFYTTLIQVGFPCPDCGEPVESDEIRVPQINYGANTNADSESSEEDTMMCPGCEREFEIEIRAGFGGGFVLIDDVDENEISVREIEFQEMEAILSNTEFYSSFMTETEKILHLNNSSVGKSESHLFYNDLEDILRRLLYAHSITCMESYLSSAFIHTVFSDSKYLKLFFENFHDLKSRKFTIAELFDSRDNFEQIAKDAISGVVFHNLAKIKPMYQEILGVELGDSGHIAKAVSIRHDIVHRNGKTKDGDIIHISQDDINDLIADVSLFVGRIELQLTPDL